ncbi:unnamed protein product [Rotaria sp. Silwood2]|nr:unnamed protein product [Rotaria sp. Silwood2]CAF4328218.1 unnamed protein product [Rotaria sp. Silwood2]CAF4861429.1 unnamed protein product [Rotaria sp. Silwood2]
MPPCRTFVAPEYKPLIIVDKSAACAECFDFIGAINGPQITNTLAPAINRLRINDMYLICDKSRLHNMANMMRPLKTGKCKSIIDIHYMPTASAKYISPLDNPIWHSFRKLVRKQYPFTTVDLSSILSRTFYSLSRQEISNAYRKCAITYGTDVYYDQPST